MNKNGLGMERKLCDLVDILTRNEGYQKVLFFLGNENPKQKLEEYLKNKNYA